ncbi:sodium-dependent transporter [Sediminitomix flava]|uniref:NSS family neurotransmitter:Na+ symporter n=1 Tax=Sediminitomix flava TaxID=379075 RepID=A0A315ZJ64_SEDFL|nr:sodium-dependent transporter [Sediminitomix flava]PWJ44878.1 NSS family neurotransmitter:Na+ symporter [Sediminitomix flava]
MAARGGFSNKFGFIMAAAGSAVGLGNIWKFPFEVVDGGGAAFVIIYLLCCFLLCFPVMIAEVAIGRKTNLNAVESFKKLGFPRWSFIGLMGIISGVLILSFYNVVAGWTIGFTFQMIQGNFEIGQQFGHFIADWKTIMIYSTVFMIATAYIVAQGVSGGIEKASKILMPTLLVIIIGLTLYSFTQEGAMNGVEYYLIPDFSKVTIQTIYGALGQAFFSLSLGMGALITYGSYVGKKDNLISSAVYITLADVSIATLAGLMMFAFLFSQNLPYDEGGAGLIYTVLPGAFASMGSTLGPILGTLFFLLLSFAALTSTVSLLEVPVAYLVDTFGLRRKRAVWLTAGGIYLLGIPSLLGNGAVPELTEFITYVGANKAASFMDFVEGIASNTMLPIGGFLICIFTTYVWNTKNLVEEVKNGNPEFANSWIASYVTFALKYLCPIILGVISIVTILDKFLGIDIV